MPLCVSCWRHRPRTVKIAAFPSCAVAVSKSARSFRLSQYWSPRFWPAWCGIGLLWVIAWLPPRLRLWLGSILGTAGYYALRRRRRIPEVNIGLCFPDLSDEEKHRLVKKSFRSNGIGYLEAATVWFRSPEIFRSRTHVHGFENLEAALRRGKGVILLGGHYSTLDLGGALYSLFAEADVMQRDHENPLFNAIMTRSRQRFYGSVLSRDNLRGLIRSLKANRVVWYATDQDYGRRVSVFAPFFGIPAATLTSTARIAAKTGAAVVPFSHFRDKDGLHYDIYFEPALDDYPSGDEVADATRTNLCIERAIRRHPDQYLWMHRRFKSEPEGKNRVKYAQK